MPTESRQGKERAQVSDELIKLMKSSSDEDAINILRRVRAGADPETVVRQVRDGNLLMQLSLVPETRRQYDLPYKADMPALLLTPDNLYVPSAILKGKAILEDTGQNPSFTKPYHAAIVSDALIDRVTISKWTTVIASDKLLRQLLRSFFQFAYAEWFPFHKDLFLSDMVTGRTEFCSPLLVNAVLANACYSFPSIAERARYWLPDNLTYRFTAEAKRLWDIEITSGRKRITTVQASQILSVIMDFDGIKSLGRVYTEQGLAMARGLGLFEASPSQVRDNMGKTRIWTAWSLYSWHSMISYYFHALPLITNPPAEPLPDDPEWYGDLYIQFPPNEMLISTHLGASFRAKCQLRAIKNAIAVQAFSHTKPDTEPWLKYAEAESFCFQLDIWRQSLPEKLWPSRIVFPKDLGTHMEYLNVITDLLRPNLSGHMDLVAGLENSPEESAKHSPVSRLLSADRHKETLLRTYYLRHNFETFDPMLVNFIIERLGACMAALNTDDTSTLRRHLPDQGTLRSTLVLCVTGLRSQAKNYHVCNLAYLGIQSQMRPEDLQLLLTYVKPPSAQDMPPLDPDSVTNWPLPIISMNEDVSKAALNNMVKGYEDFGG
ncbi:hypothetical protein E8E13_006619 [Curvularia kusanoi]|uniref:Xylanolytic transcriptional activator regulatory domain-containing protein n=1 Tax=Curvularia kusanoi TaxID=90978 RepID=A0A9P4TGW4_CURKU|nr:hypothetical protein E8E13_006619 [Curvularia kusanoi]